MWSPASTTTYFGRIERMMSRFWNTASAVPRYQCAPSTRCWAGHRSMNSLNSPRRKPQPRWTCRISECALYCVTTAIRRMPEFRQLDSAKSMIRYLPPKCTAGLTRLLVSGPSRVPRPPARTIARVVRCRSLRLAGVSMLCLLCPMQPGCWWCAPIDYAGCFSCRFWSRCGLLSRCLDDCLLFLAPNGHPRIVWIMWMPNES